MLGRSEMGTSGFDDGSEAIGGETGIMELGSQGPAGRTYRHRGPLLVTTPPVCQNAASSQSLPG